MIVIGVDVHKHSLTAVAVDEAGRLLDELTVEYPDEVVVGVGGCSLASSGCGLLRIAGM